MKYHIIISHQCAEFISGDFTGEEIHIADRNLPEYLQEAVEGCSDICALIILLSADEYGASVEFLSQVTGIDVYFSCIVFGDYSLLQGLDSEYIKYISEVRAAGISGDEFNFLTYKTKSQLDSSIEERIKQKEYLTTLIDTRQDQDDLIDIGKSLNSEKDMDKLLTMILFLSKKITGADAGSIYLVEEDEDGKKRLRFKTSHTFSREIPLNEFVIPMDERSIAGYVAVTGEVLNIPDVYKLNEMEHYSLSHNSSFDKQHDYITRSMLVVPMRNYHDEIIGVIQLINSKEDLTNNENAGNEAFTTLLEVEEDFNRYVVTFDEKYDSLLEAIAGQAAVAIENNRLIKQIQEQFEEFVKASVTAIESRDPATSGHSFRVAEICKAMAYAVNEIEDGYLGQFYFSDDNVRELEFAALLHDFGKVYIDLSIFQKEKKLFPKDLENLLIRLDYLYRYVELQYHMKEEELYEEMNPDKEKLQKLKVEMYDNLDNILSIKNRIRTLNEPTVIDDDPEKIIENLRGEINSMNCAGIDGNPMDIISDSDRLNLIIRRGSLNPEERKVIESHVVHTHNFVSKIPWPPEYKNIPEIALRHHEKINGGGYPDGLKGRESTMIQSRIMSIADIYDALAASDRPYKAAVPKERILKILNEEAERGVLDKDLVSVFIDHRIYEKVDSESFRFVEEGNE